MALLEAESGAVDLSRLHEEYTPAVPPDIIEFVTSPEYLNRSIYPRQATLLKVIFLQTELFTDYDYQVLAEWSEGFSLPEDPDLEKALIHEGMWGIQPDVLERIEMCKREGRKWFREVLAVIGRRGGKGYLGALCGAYILWHYICTYDPQDHYGIDRDKRLAAMVYAGKKDQAKANQWRDLVNVIINAPCFTGGRYKNLISRALGETLTVLAPHDRERVRSLEASGVKTDMDMATFEIVPKEATLMGGRGPAAFMIFFDEMAHVVATGASRGADELYDSATPALDQFGKDGFVYAGSSPWQMIGKFYELCQQALEVEHFTHEPVHYDKLIIQLTSWDIYEDWDSAHAIPLVPKAYARKLHEQGNDFYTHVQRNRHGRIRARAKCFRRLKGAIQTYDSQMQRLERANPETFAVERRSHWASAQDSYLNSVLVARMFEPWPADRTLTMQTKGVIKRTYAAHADPSKCLTGDSLVFTDQGIMRLVQVEGGDLLANSVGVDRVDEWIESGEKEVFRLRLGYGYEVRGSAEHPVLTDGGWVRLGDLRKGQRVAIRQPDLWATEYVEVPIARVPKRSNGKMCTPPAKVDERMGRLFGYLVAEGHFDHHELTVTAHVDEVTCDETVGLVRDLFGVEPSWEYTKGKGRTVGWQNTHLMLVLAELGLLPIVRAAQKEVPWSILQSPRSVVQEFLRGYFYGDGCVTSPDAKDRNVNVVTASAELARQVHLLLLNLGIVAQRSSYMASVNAAGERRRYWRVLARGEYLRRFQAEVGFPPGHKMDRLKAHASRDVTPVPDEVFQPVVEVVSDGIEMTYDLTMRSGHHNFVADGIVCHNSNANFGWAIAHTEGPDENGLMHVVFDKIHYWAPHHWDDGQVDYIEIGQEIGDDVVAFLPELVTFDQFNSVEAMQRIRRRVRESQLPKHITIEERTATAPLNWKMAETFKTALGLNLIHAPYHEQAELEARFLQVKGNKVDHPTMGPVQTKDVWDAMANVVYALIGDQMEAFLKSELRDLSIGGTAKGGLSNNDPAGRTEHEIMNQLSALSTRGVRPGAAPTPRHRGPSGAQRRDRR